MSTLLRVTTCALLAANVVSLSTNFMQRDAMATKEGLFRWSKDAPSQPFGEMVNSEMSLWLKRLRGADNASALPWPREDRALVNVGKADVYMGGLSAAKSAKFQLPKTRDMVVSAFVVVAILGCCALCIFVLEEHASPDDQIPAKPPEDLKGMEACDGTWARTYQNADGQSKQGLELLFRCHIIPTEEFAHSRVSQEHIDECVWIATHMLRQRKLEEWTEVWPEALRAFEESVTACFVARTDVRSTFCDEGAAIGQAASGDQTAGSSAAMQAFGDPIARSGGGSSSADKMEMSSGPQERMSAAKSKPQPERTPEALPPVLKTPEDRKSLMDRCRQIMAASDAQKRPWTSAPAGSLLRDQDGGSSVASQPQKPWKQVD